MQDFFPYVLWHQFASDELLEHAQKTAKTNRDKFIDTTVETNVTGFRQSKVCWNWEWMDLYHAFINRLDYALPVLKAHFPIFPPDPEYELQLTVSGDGDFFKRHQDNASATTQSRILTFVYYFGMTARPGFSGGQLVIDAPAGQHVIEPTHNSLVIFPADYWHEVLPVTVPTQSWEDGRTTLNGWVHNGRLRNK